VVRTGSKHERCPPELKFRLNIEMDVGVESRGDFRHVGQGFSPAFRR